MPSGTCAHCGAERRWLHKHHLKLQCDGGTDADGTELICANCHEDVHEGPMGGRSVAHRRHNPEINAKRSEAMRQQWADPEARARMLATRRPRVSPSVEERLAISQRMRERWADPSDPLRVNQAMFDGQIRELREKGHTHEDIATEIGCTRSTVIRSLARSGGDPVSRSESQRKRREAERTEGTS